MFVAQLQENVALFGGDRFNVTLMGHGKGAVLVNWLMISSAVPTGSINIGLLLTFTINQITIVNLAICDQTESGALFFKKVWNKVKFLSKGDI